MTTIGAARGAFAQSVFTSGSLVVDQLGNGTTTIPSNSNATAVVLDQFLPNGASTQTASVTLAVPTSGSALLTNGGKDTGPNYKTEGVITASTNGLVFNIAGYNASVGTAVPSQRLSSVYARVSDFVGADGTFTRSGSTSTYINPTSDNVSSAIAANTIRSAVSLGGPGSDVYVTTMGTTAADAGGSGIIDLTTNTIVSSTVTNARIGGIFAGASGGQLYFSTSSSSPGDAGIYQVGTGLPTAAGTTSTVVIDAKTMTPFGTSSSPDGFSFNTALTVAYMSDANGGIEKFTNNGSGWVLAGIATAAANSSTLAAARALTVDWSNPNAPVIYAVNGAQTAIVKVVDTGTTGTATINSTTQNTFGAMTTVANARTTGVTTLFKGVAIALQPSVWTTPAADGSTSNWDTGGNTQFSNFSQIQVAGSNVAFQNVNSTATTTPVNLTVNNNSTVGSVSSINFTPGYGTNAAGTAYTLTGSGLTVTGGPATSAIGTVANGYTPVVANNTAVTQTINLPVTLGAANQSFSATTGNLVFGVGGTIATAGNALAIRGANTTVVAGGITGTGTVTVGDGVTLNSGTLSGTGTIAAPITVANGGTITAGTATGSVDRLTTTAPETWQAGGTFLAESNGTTADRLILSSLILPSAAQSFTVNVVSSTLPTPTPGTAILLATDQETTNNAFGSGTPAALSLRINGADPSASGYVLSTQLDTDLTGGGYDLILTAAPEPTSLLLATLTAAPLALGRRRARSAGRLAR